MGTGSVYDWLIVLGKTRQPQGALLFLTHSHFVLHPVQTCTSHAAPASTMSQSYQCVMLSSYAVHACILLQPLCVIVRVVRQNSIPPAQMAATAWTLL